MNSIIIALWVIATEGIILLIIFIFFFVAIRREISNTLKETQTLLKTLENKVSLLSDELHNTLKNTTDITSHAKQSMKKIDGILMLIGGAAIAVPLISGARKSKSKENSSSILGKLLSFGSFLVSVQKGFDLYRKFARKEDRTNGWR